MRLNYVTLCDERMPAYRYRMKLPGEYIGNYSITKRPEEADIHIFSKPYHSRPDLLALSLKSASKLPFVLDICDDVFKRDSLVPAYMVRMALMAQAVTVPTKGLQDRVRTETGVEAVVISDPCEFPRRGIKDISEPKIMWFGNGTNLKTLSGIDHTDLEVDVICSESVKKYIDVVENFTFYEWSLDGMKKAFDRNNIVIIPSIKERTNNHNWMMKSPNRVFESIRSGLSVVAAPIPEYKQFDISLDWDIKEALNNIKKTTTELQDYVDSKFDISVIGEQWKLLFKQVISNSTLDAGAGCLRAG